MTYSRVCVFVLPITLLSSYIRHKLYFILLYKFIFVDLSCIFIFINYSILLFAFSKGLILKMYIFMHMSISVLCHMGNLFMLFVYNVCNLEGPTVDELCSVCMQ